MATQLFLLNSNADTHLGADNAILTGSFFGWTPRALGLARGSGVVASDAVSTSTGPIAGFEVTSGAISLEWLSPPLAADVTIAGTITLNIWAAESNMSANVAINARIDVVRANETQSRNSNTIAAIATSTRVTEVAVTTRAVNNFTVTPTSTVVRRGDRIRVRIFGDDAGTMATGFTFNASYNGTSAAADGDTYVTFTENFSFESAPSGSVLYLTNATPSIDTGTLSSPALVSAFAGGNASPLSEGGNWARLDTSGFNNLQLISNAVSGDTVSVSCASYWTAADFGPDLEAYMTMSTIGTQNGIYVRLQGAGGAGTYDGYRVVAIGTQTSIVRFDNAASTAIATITNSAWASGDKLGVRCFGNVIQAWRMLSGTTYWTLLGEAVDSTYSAAGKVGIFCFSNVARLDDFTVGTDANSFTWGPDAPALISDFTGSDENPLSEGGNWANLNSSSNPLKRISNAASGSAAISNSYWTPANLGPNLEAYVTLSTISGDSVGISARIQGEGGAGTWDGYRVRCTSSSVFIERIDNSVATTLLTGSMGDTIVDGDKLGIRLQGSTIQAWFQDISVSANWKLVLIAIDTTYPGAGKIGLYSSFSDARIDDFYAATNSMLFPPKAWTSRGAGVVSYLTDTDVGWIAPYLGGEWYTPPLNAFTLEGMAVGNIRALESNASANASVRCEIARVDMDGDNPQVWGSWCIAPEATDAAPGELTTSEAARTANISGDSLAFTDGQRIRIRLYQDNISSASMANAFNTQVFYNGTSGGASGDTYITLPQTVTEYTPPGGGTPGPVWKKRRADRFLTMR